MIILISGPSGCGKSTLSKRLLEQLEDSNSKLLGSKLPGWILIKQDDHFAQDYVDYKDRKDDSFESPAGVNWVSIREKVKRSALTHGVIVEGHMLITDTQLVSMASLTVLLSSSCEISKRRRLHRRPRSKEEIQNLEDYFDKYVWPSHENYWIPASRKLCEINLPTLDIKSDDGRSSLEYVQDIIKTLTSFPSVIQPI